MEVSAPLSNFTNEVMWKSFDKRLAQFLLSEATMEGSHVLPITHEMIGNHLGHPREVVTRMLKYFMQAALELLRTLADADEDVRAGRAVPIENTFSDIREMLLKRKNDEV